ncbi:hypothetical protein ABZ858_33415 [Streptomyces sp. NPDC047017]|uniref:hypothetical protein n=1 Tax=Streptomyces sp. NPDC047017 TaxID=3155024 RepID=UPI0033D389FF
MYRHHIAPPRAFTQFAHDLIRHPRLSSDAVRLLTWQLSLPQGARESLSRSAERARIGATAFSRAKAQLKAEGYVHERRVQGPGGLWVTRQLVSNVPLNAAEAAKLLARTPMTPVTPVTPVTSVTSVGATSAADAVQAVRASPRTGRTAPPPTCADLESPQLAPSPAVPAVGAPSPRSTGGQPGKDPGGNTSHHPAAGPARALVAALPGLARELRDIPRGMYGELAQLTDRWLAAGHTPAAIRTHILRGLPDDGTPVRRPGGLLRHLLREVPPPPPARRPEPPPAPGAAPRLSARLAGTRECEGDHVQPCLFRPAGAERLCPSCASRGDSCGDYRGDSCGETNIARPRATHGPGLRSLRLDPE